MRVLVCFVVAAVLLGCLSPQDRRPGLMLAGRAVPAPADWSFTDEHKEIAIQVQPPYIIPHSVTVWCGSVDGRLYLAARDPETKRWPGWVDLHPMVRLGIAGLLYDGRLVDVEDPAEIDAVAASYRAKYELPEMPSSVRYWRFEN